MEKFLPSLVIGGPTASGKTDLSLRIAEAIGAEIVCADAFQIYRGLSILTAQPDETCLSRARHHLFGEVDAAESCDVSRYLAWARERIADIHRRNKPSILVGGSGMYIRAVLRGLSEGLPGADPDLRAKLERKTPAELVGELIRVDPRAKNTIDLKNPRRVIRALEVFLLTGRPFTSFRIEQAGDILQPRCGLWIQIPRDELHARIRTRTLQFFKKGVCREIEALRNHIGPTASQAIGFREIRRQIDGEISQSESERLIIEATRQYARRQETWFRKEPLLECLTEPAAFTAALNMVRGTGFEPVTSCV